MTQRLSRSYARAIERARRKLFPGQTLVLCHQPNARTRQHVNLLTINGSWLASYADVEIDSNSNEKQRRLVIIISDRAELTPDVVETISSVRIGNTRYTIDGQPLQPLAEPRKWILFCLPTGVNDAV